MILKEITAFFSEAFQGAEYSYLEDMKYFFCNFWKKWIILGWNRLKFSLIGDRADGIFSLRSVA